jgi:catechol 2,3-dioxygenase-like lactoylglutathione lyase family enzyme
MSRQGAGLMRRPGARRRLRTPPPTRSDKFAGCWGLSEVIAFAGAADLGRAREFYEHVLGLRLVEQNDFACVFDANGTMLRVTAVGEPARAPYAVLGWRVRDIVPAVRGLAGRGVSFLRYDGMDQDEDGIWTAPGGDMVAWFADPDANVLSVSQFYQSSWEILS